MNDIPDRSADTGDLHELSPLYAVDALEPAERTAFEAHLAGCPRCRAEVADYAETTARLAEMVSLEPPPDLRATVLEAVHGTLPLPAQAPAAVARPLPGGIGGDEQQVPGRGPGEPARPHPGSRRGSRVPLEALRRRYRRVLALAVATALVPSVVVGGWGLGVQAEQRHQEQQVTQEQDRENRLLAASDLTAHRIEVAGRAGTLYVSQKQDTALLVSSGLPDPGEHKEYQLWLMHGDAPIPDVHFSGAQPRTWLTGDVADADAVAMTVEPAGGSTTPTLPLVASTEI